MAAEEEKASREENGSSSSLFQSPLETDLWLFPRKSPAPDSAVPPQEEEEEDKWLLRKRSQAQVSTAGAEHTRGLVAARFRLPDCFLFPL